MIYLHTSALVKLIAHEPNTPALLDWLQQQSGYTAVTSSLSRVELTRTALTDGTPGMTERAHNLLDTLDIIAVTDTVISTAETIGPPSLHPLDAIHLAAAAQIADELTVFISYDTALLAASRELGYPTENPT